MHAKIEELQIKSSSGKFRRLLYPDELIILRKFSYLCKGEQIDKNMALKLYPIGIQTFERIRKEDKLYIDKTAYVYRMTHTSGTFFFLSRPRRFGKSLLVSTFQSYFEGKKELFKGLAIEKYEKEWESYPVVHLDMSGGKHMDKDQLQRYLLDMLSDNEKRFGISSEHIDPNIRLKNLIHSIYEQTGKQVVVLIDEYDAPLLDVSTKTPTSTSWDKPCAISSVR